MRAKRTALVLRVCGPDMTSSHEFVWPGVGETATAADWSSVPRCGHGLHGWLHGIGDHSCAADITDDSKWLVVEVALAQIIEFAGKIKFPAGKVKFVGDRKSATDYLLAHDALAREGAVIGAQRQVGDYGAVQVGAFGQATAGDYGTATAGDYGTATAGNRGTATAGDHGTATAGDSGTATADDYGTAMAGDYGQLRIRWHDGNRYRTAIAYVGEDGIKPDTAYRLDANHKFAEVTL